jgi:two-component system chemotaxis sensor kinase CheA
MDEFLAQFLIESRELVDQAVDDLLSLESAPGDSERFDDVFRAFHTLKGGAGIVEFAAMEQALHCAENVLADARTDAAQLTTHDIGNCLMCLDQVAEWLDEIQRTEALPPDATSAAVVARFAAAGPDARRPAHTEAAPADPWLDALLRAHAAAAAQARMAIRYVPIADSFLRHKDPVALVAALPGLLAVDVGPRDVWTTLEELDPFSCNLAIAALTTGSAEEAAAIFGDEIRLCEVRTLTRPAAADEAGSLLTRAREVLEAQVNLLADVGDAQSAGRVASAGAVAANVLRSIGRSAEAERIATATAETVAVGAPERLRQAIAAALAERPVATPADAAPVRRPESAARTLRVDAERIDALVRLTGELTVAKNAIGHAVKLAQSESASFAAMLKNRHASLERLVGELQRSVIAMRVLPLRIAFQRFPRLIREMSAELNKPATLVLEGQDTEADKAIVEILVEPLVHVLRNAMDHGIEDAAARAAAGKPAVATIRLHAFRSGQHVCIEVSDDGRGVDVARVREVARERNVVRADALDAMSDAEVIDLIFAAGFSTAAIVTEFSGRGVGMDAVRTAVKRIGGHVEASSTPGKGTTVRFTLPFSVMMTRVMTVEAGGQTFGVPLDAVVETIRVPKDGIFAVGTAHAIVFRQRTIPLVRLGQALGASVPQDGGDAVPIVIANAEGELGALQVDKIGERMEVMLKPLDGLLAGLPSIAGSTLLGDGSVLLILDLAELLQ